MKVKKVNNHLTLLTGNANNNASRYEYRYGLYAHKLGTVQK